MLSKTDYMQQHFLNGTIHVVFLVHDLDSMAATFLFLWLSCFVSV